MTSRELERLERRESALLARRDLADVASFFARSCAASRAHSALAAYCLQAFGDHGAQISGCVRYHFPPAYKEALRALARAVSDENESGFALRPRRVRRTTLQELGRAIARRDGAGFYGFQPSGLCAIIQPGFLTQGVGQ